MTGKTLLRINMGSQQGTGFDGLIFDGFLISGGDQIVGSGTPGGGGGGATYMSDLEDVSLTNLSNGQMLAWNGSAWVNVAAPTGTVTSVSLAGGTNNGTLKLTVNGTPTDNIAVTGWSSKADASALNDYVTLATAQTITGRKTFTSQSAVIFQQDASYQNRYTEGIRFNLGGPGLWAGFTIGGTATSGTGTGIWAFLVNSNNFCIGHDGSNTAAVGLNWSAAGALNFKTTTFTNNGYTIWHSGNFRAGYEYQTPIAANTYAPYYSAGYVKKDGDSMSGSLTASSFIKSGGTSSQFLKADGSVDSTVYVDAAGARSACDGRYIYEPTSGNTTTTSFRTYNDSNETGICFRRNGTDTAHVGTYSDNVYLHTNGWYFRLYDYGYTRYTGALIVGGSTGGGWNEGIRIKPYLGWSTICLDDSTHTGWTGTSANVWSLHNNEGNLYLTRNGASTSSAALFQCVSNLWEFSVGDVKVANNFGVGTTPNYKFHVSGSAGNSAILAYIENTNNVEWNSTLIGYAPNITAGHNVSSAIGVESGTYNAGGLQFYYSGNGLASNCIGLGLWSQDYVLACYGTGRVTIGYGATGSAQTDKLAVNGSIGATSYTASPTNTHGFRVNTSLRTWSYLRLDNHSTYWDLATISDGSTYIGQADAFEIRDEQSNYSGISIRSNTSSYGKLVITTETGECSLGFWSTAHNPISGKPIWVIGYKGTNNEFGWYNTNGTEGWRMTLTATGSLITTGDQVITSDATKKTNPKDLTYTLEQIANAPAISFDWKYKPGHSFGSIAQYWKPICPEMVLGEEGNYTLAYAQGAFTNGIIIAREVKSLQDKFVPLFEKYEPIFNRVNTHEDQINQLNKKLELANQEILRLRSEINSLRGMNYGI